jgi:hypothetical protein
MFFTFFKHDFLRFTRAHYLEQSLGMKLVIGLVLLITARLIYVFGLFAPEWLMVFMPDKHPHEALFSLLFFIYAGDLLVRLFMQKIPVQQSICYLHLPVKRSGLAGIVLLKSWFSLYNFYLLLFFIPFFSRTIIPNFSIQSFWFILTGCFLLGGVTHSIALLWKTTRQKSRVSVYVSLIVGLSLGLFTWWQPEWVMDASLGAAQALMSGNPLAFGLLFLALGYFQKLIHQNLHKGFYDLYGQPAYREKTSGNRIQKGLDKVPEYGMYWNLEWMLLTRNKRSRNAFYQTPLYIPMIIILLLNIHEDLLLYSAPILMMGMGSYGFFHLQHVFSWESHFFDFIASRPINLHTFIRAKYYFYLLIALAQYIIILILFIFTNPSVIPFMTGIFLYVCGLVFCLMFFTGSGYSTRIDPNKKASLNFEGLRGTMFFIMILISLSIIPFLLIGAMIPLPIPWGFSLASGASGLLLIVFSRAWTARLADTFERKKYRNLSKYREK